MGRDVVSLPATAPAAMVEVGKENVFVGDMDACSVKLSSTAKGAHNVLKWAMKSLCLV